MIKKKFYDFDNSSNTLSTLSFNLAKHPEVQVGYFTL
jgi:hypothetical protein